MLRFLREALSGTKVSRTYDSLTINGFTVNLVPALLHPSFSLLFSLAWCGSAQPSDGVILNWVSPADVALSADLIRGAPINHGNSSLGCS